MATATLNVNVRDRRMLTRSEAAHYVGLSAKSFTRECPVAPVKFDSGERFDKRELDAWLDAFKAGAGFDQDQDILARLE